MTKPSDFEASLLPSSIVYLQSLDLRVPHDAVRIGDHTRRFNQTVIDGAVLYIPTGITYNEVGRCWRVYFQKDRKPVVEYFSVNDYPSLYDALQDAWVYLVSLLKANPRLGNTPTGAAQKLRTGMTGVVFRQNRNRQGTISRVDIRVHQFVKGVVNNTRIASITRDFDQNEFESFLRTAYGVRRYSDYLRIQNGPLNEAVKVGDVPDSFIEQPLPIPVRVHDLFKEYPETK